jgi:Family of unknown function (DUF6328)
VGDDPEDEDAKTDRRLNELLTELRVVLPGVQMLFGFMLILPFSNGFTRTTSLERAVYFGAFLCGTMATILFLTPSIYHRMRFHQHDRPRLVETANSLAIAGSFFLALAIAGSVYVITSVLIDSAVAAAVGAGAVAVLAWFWYGLPLKRRIDDEERSDGHPAKSAR